MCVRKVFLDCPGTRRPLIRSSCCPGVTVCASAFHAPHSSECHPASCTHTHWSGPLVGAVHVSDWPLCWAWTVQARQFKNSLLPSPRAGCGARGSPLGMPSMLCWCHLHGRGVLRLLPFGPAPLSPVLPPLESPRPGHAGPQHSRPTQSAMHGRRGVQPHCLAGPATRLGRTRPSCPGQRCSVPDSETLHRDVQAD